MKNIVDWASKMAEKFAEDWKHHLGKTIGKINDVYDVLKVLYNCSGIDAYLGSIFLVYVLMLGMLVWALPGVWFVIGVLLVGIATSKWVDATIANCKS